MKKLILVMMLCLGLAGVSPAWAQTFFNQDVGTPVPGSTAVNADGSISIVAGGNDIWGTSDNCHFAYVPMSGDFTIQARVVSVAALPDNTENAWRKAGVMVRETLDGNSVNVAMLMAPGQPTATYQVRPTTGADSTSIHGNTETTPEWVRIVRSGSSFRGEWSNDGVTWTQESVYTQTMPNTVYVGLVVTSHEAGNLAEGVFDNVTLNDAPFYWGAAVDSPAVGETDIVPGITALSWTAIERPGETIQSYKVYLADNYDAVDPNSANVEDALLGTTTETTIDTFELLPSTTYYWRVASLINDANQSDGLIWNFSTENWGPVFTQQPEDTYFGPACEGVVTVVAEPAVEGLGEEITIEWYRVVEGGDDELVVSGDTLVTSQFARYYAVATNDYGVTQSNVVTVGEGTGLTELEIAEFGTSTGHLDETVISPDGTIELTADGADIWGTSDGFTFAYLPQEGDFDVSVRFVEATGPGANEWRKWGLMVRDELTAGSQHAFIAATGSNGTAWQGRFAADTDSQGNSSGHAPTTNPRWLRIKREGDTFTAYSSPDGVTWTQVPGSGEITNPRDWQMTDPVYVGMAVTSHEDGVNSTGVFDNFSLAGRDWNPANVMFAPLGAGGTGWLDYAATEVTVTWEPAKYGPCDATYDLYMSMDEAAVADPESGLAPLASGLTDMSATIQNAGVLDLEHDQTWYYRIDVKRQGSDDVFYGAVSSIDTIKWVPLIEEQPPSLTNIKAGLDLTLNCVVSTLNEDQAALRGFQWKRVVGDKDDDLDGDDELILDGEVIETDRNGKRWYDCSMILSVDNVAAEGEYYCVGINDNGIAISENARVLTERMVLHYSFDEINGNTVPDLSDGVKFDGTLVSTQDGGAPVIGGLEPGIVGNAIRLVGGEDPNNAYIATGASARDLGMMGGRPRSISVWVNAVDMKRSGVYSVGQYNSNLQMFALHTGDSLGHTWQFDHWSGNFDLTLVPSFNAWVHFVHVYDGANVVIYANGEQVADYAAALNTASGGTAQDLAIGYWGDFNAGFQHGVFRGLIDEVKVFNYALSPAEAGTLWLEGPAEGPLCMIDSPYDLNGDCRVDLADFAIFAPEWLQDTLIAP